MEDSHVRILERRRCWMKWQPWGWFHCRVGKIQLQSFTFTWGQKEKNRSRSPHDVDTTLGCTRQCKQKSVISHLYFRQTWDEPSYMHAVNHVEKEMATLRPCQNMSTSQCSFIKLAEYWEQKKHTCGIISTEKLFSRLRKAQNLLWTQTKWPREQEFAVFMLCTSDFSCVDHHAIKQ